MTSTRELTCINCPKSCRLTAVMDGDTIVRIEGAECRRGTTYAREEITDPRRTVTTTVHIRGATPALLPVRTSEPVPKGRVAAVLAVARALSVEAPVTAGQVLIANVAGSGSALIATRAMPAAYESASPFLSDR